MLPAYSFTDVNNSLRHEMSPTERNRNIKLAGIVFCQPHSKFAKEEILPALRYFHGRSGPCVNFYFVGYYPGQEGHPNDIKVESPIAGSEWIFSPEAFNEFRTELERSTSWQYSGGADFILVNAQFNSDPEGSCLDFGSAIAVNFDRLAQEVPSFNVGIFFENIFKSAESRSQFDIVSRISNKEGNKLIHGAIKHIVLSVLPSSFQREARAAFNYVVTDLRPKKGPRST